MNASPVRPVPARDALAQTHAWLATLAADAVPRAAEWRIALGLVLCDAPEEACAVLAREHGGAEVPGSDATFVGAVAVAALGERAPSAARSALRAGAERETLPVRRAILRALLDADAGALPEAPTAREAEAIFLAGDDPAAAELADLLAARGCAAGFGDERIALAAAGRAFAALRARRGFARGCALVRVVAAHSADPILLDYAGHALTRERRIDGSFGDLPPVTAEAGDIRAAYHLPRTVHALLALRDLHVRSSFLASVVTA